jgi:hypothetical protein
VGGLRLRSSLALALAGAALAWPASGMAEAPPGATAQCRDGTYSFSQTHSGTCSHHGGVAQWLDGAAVQAAPTAPAPAAASPGKPIKADPTRTPGEDNPAVTQATIGATICMSGWTRTVRPPTSYTNALKVKQMAQYGENGSPTGYEEDHLIPLELGGAPRDPRNLWPEPHPRSATVDGIETHLKSLVCHGAMTLAAARSEIASIKHLHG